jgi:hypothetical protein
MAAPSSSAIHPQSVGSQTSLRRIKTQATGAR